MSKVTKEKNELDVEKLTEELLISRKNGFFDVTDKEVSKADSFCEGYKVFFRSLKNRTRSRRICGCRGGKRRLPSFDRKKKYKPGDKVYYNNRGKALILAVIGEESCREGVRIAAAHIDSPRLDLKPYPLYEEPMSWCCLKPIITEALKSTSGPRSRWRCMAGLSAGTAHIWISALGKSQGSRSSA